MSDLTEQEASKLFEEVSKATRENDTLKLSEIMSTEGVQDTPPAEEAPAEEPAVDQDADSPTEETQEETPSEEDGAPPTKAEETVEELAKQELSEVDKLKEQLESLKRENHRLSSAAGRVPHLQRKVKDIDRKLEELTKQTTSPSSQPSTKIQPKILEALKGIKETDPELADVISKVIAEATDGVAEDLTTKEIESLKAQRDETVKEYQKAEAERLLDMYPNAVEVFQSTGWKEWKAKQTPQLAAFANSGNADDVSFAFEQFANDMLKLHPELAKVEGSKTEVATPAETAEAAKKIEAERQRKKQVAVNISNPTTPGKVAMPDDPQALFERFSNEIRKQRTG